MPMDKSRYPADWDDISLRIKERCGWKCAQCGVEHGATIMRHMGNPAHYIVRHDDGCWYTADGVRLLPTQLETFDHSKVVKVCLTTHHIGVPKPDGSAGSPHDKMDCRDENLTALCQRCHFIADLPSHIVSARESRIRNKRLRKIKSGQTELW